MPLAKIRQLGLKHEVTEGTDPTLASADYSGNRTDISVDIQRSEIERDIDQATLSKLGFVPGSETASVSFKEEVVGGDVSTQAPWEKMIAACGMDSLDLYKIQIGAPTGGTFVPGQTIGDNATQGSATKVGVVVHYQQASDGNHYLIFDRVSGASFVDTDDVYNYESSQVSASVDSSESAGGRVWTPLSETDVQTPTSAWIEGRSAVGNLMQFAACRGTFKIMFGHDENLVMDFNFQGVPVYHADGGWPAGSVLTDVPEVVGKPVAGKFFPIFLDEYSPVATKFEVDVGNTLTNGADIGGGLHKSGRTATRITDRDVRISVDPEVPIKATHDFLKQWQQSDQFPVRILAGDPESTTGALLVYGPKAQMRGNYTESERDGLVIFEPDLQLIGSVDDEISIAHVFI